MAEVDFSNAIIEPYTDSIIYAERTKINQTTPGYVALYYPDGKEFLDSNGNRISVPTITQLVNQRKELVYQYQGTFGASGTLFYLLHSDQGGNWITGWKISNISFSSGDTYLFRIRADLICQ